MPASIPFDFFGPEHITPMRSLNQFQDDFIMWLDPLTKWVVVDNAQTLNNAMNKLGWHPWQFWMAIVAASGLFWFLVMNILTRIHPALPLGLGIYAYLGRGEGSYGLIAAILVYAVKLLSQIGRGVQAKTTATSPWVQAAQGYGFFQQPVYKSARDNALLYFFSGLAVTVVVSVVEPGSHQAYVLTSIIPVCIAAALSCIVPGAGGNSMPTGGLLMVLIFSMYSMPFAMDRVVIILEKLLELTQTTKVTIATPVMSMAQSATWGSPDIGIVNLMQGLDLIRTLSGMAVMAYMATDDWFGPGIAVSQAALMKTKDRQGKEGLLTSAGIYRSTHVIALLMQIGWEVAFGHGLGLAMHVLGLAIGMVIWWFIGRPSWGGRGVNMAMDSLRSGLMQVIGEGPRGLRIMVVLFTSISLCIALAASKNTPFYVTMLLTILIFKDNEQALSIILAVLTANPGMGIMGVWCLRTGERPYTGSLNNPDNVVPTVQGLGENSKKKPRPPNMPDDAIEIDTKAAVGWVVMDFYWSLDLIFTDEEFKEYKLINNYVLRLQDDTKLKTCDDYVVTTMAGMTVAHSIGYKTTPDQPEADEAMELPEEAEFLDAPKEAKPGKTYWNVSRKFTAPEIETLPKGKFYLLRSDCDVDGWNVKTVMGQRCLIRDDLQPG